MIRLYKLLMLLVATVVLSACATYPAGWSQSCSMPSGSYQAENGLYSMELDGDERDSCHKGSFGDRKQRSEIQHSVEQDKLYEFEYEFKYVGAGGATIMQLHPGRPSSVKVGIWSECDQISIVAGYYKVRLNVPGMTELQGISDDDYKNNWHKVVMRFRASNDDPLYQFDFDGETVFDSEKESGGNDLCYYKGKKPSLKLGLYRGKREVKETIYYRNINVTKLD